MSHQQQQPDGTHDCKEAADIVMNLIAARWAAAEYFGEEVFPYVDDDLPEEMNQALRDYYPSDPKERADLERSTAAFDAGFERACRNNPRSPVPLGDLYAVLVSRGTTLPRTPRFHW